MQREEEEEERKWRTWRVTQQWKKKMTNRQR